jgi:hypothetical protein
LSVLVSGCLGDVEVDVDGEAHGLGTGQLPAPTLSLTITGPGLLLQGGKAHLAVDCLLTWEWTACSALPFLDCCLGAPLPHKRVATLWKGLLIPPTAEFLRGSQSQPLTELSRKMDSQSLHIQTFLAGH